MVHSIREASSGRISTKKIATKYAALTLRSPRFRSLTAFPGVPIFLHVASACSTCWNSERHIRGDQMLAEIWDLGFRHVELGHGIRVSMLTGIKDFLRDHDLEVTSLHNFCPLPVDVFQASPDSLQCTSNDAHERKRAERHTLATIDQAFNLGASRVVLHLGFVPMGNATRRLLQQIYQGRLFSRQFVRTKLGALQRREKIDLCPRVLEWLQPVITHAAGAGVLLGIENRFRIETFPSESEFQKLFEALDPKVVGYWHDFGHAQIRHNLTLIDHAEWLGSVAHRLVGCHIHDVIYPDRDHRVPFSGTIPFRNLLTMIPRTLPLVWEPAPSMPAQAIREAFDQWNELLRHEQGTVRDAA
jgi:sugar phosphate isomerase/epimerase